MLAVALAACAAPAPAGPTEVRVTLADFTIESSVSEFSAGVPYHFVVVNKGSIAHEIMIMPVAHDDHHESMEEMHETALAVVEEADLPPGATQTFDFTFAESVSLGALEFACHVPGHYDAGMHLPIAVN